MISGRTTLIAHLGYPIESFKAPMIYNPWFDRNGIDAVVVPMGVKSEDYPRFLRTLFRVSNIHGALVTMPHKMTTVTLLDEVTPAVEIAGACNAILRRPDGTLLGDMVDGEGFVRGVERKGRPVAGARILVVGCGGAGSAIAASLAAARSAEIGLFDVDSGKAIALRDRLRAHHPGFDVATGSPDPAGYDIVVNATPLGMNEDDPLPFEVSRLAPETFVGEVVMKEAFTPMLRAAKARGCEVLIGTDMLFEQIPAYLEFFGYGKPTPEELRAIATIEY